MKRFLIFLSIFTPCLFASVLLVAPAFATNCGGMETSLIECEEGGDGGIYVLLGTILNILTVGVGVAGVLGIVISGIQYMTASGDVAQTTKAKRRLIEVIVGLIAWGLMWAFLEWLIPGGVINSSTGVESMSATFESAEVGKTVTPTIEFTPKDVSDRTYSLKSSDDSIAKPNITSVRCVSVGTATITITASNKITTTASIECKEATKPASTVADDRNPTGASGKLPSGALSEEQVNSQVASMSIPTDAELQSAASAIGMNSTNLNKLLRLSHREGGYVDLKGSHYAKYLNVCTMVNHYTDNPSAEFYGNWGGGDGSYNESEMSKSIYNPGDEDKIYAYLALTHTNTEAWDAHGIMKENGYSYYGEWGRTVQRSSEAIYCTEYWKGNYGCIWPRSAGWYKE